MELISDTSKSYKMKLRSRRGPLTQQADPIQLFLLVRYFLFTPFVHLYPEAGLLTSKCDQFYIIKMYLLIPKAMAQLELLLPELESFWRVLKILIWTCM
jgi:hypothetical protein